MNPLLHEKDEQINQLRNFIASQEGSYIEKGIRSSDRINELEEQLQQRGNEYYRIKDELIKQEQLLKLDIQKLRDENTLLVSTVYVMN